MEILCDIIVTDPSFSRVLATPTMLGWLLPIVRAREAARVTDDVRLLLQRVGVDGTFVHEAWLPADPGQQPEARRYCLVIISTEPKSGAARPVEWIGLDKVLSTRAAFPSQQLGLRTCLDRVRHPSAPFDSLAPIADADSWIDSTLTRLGRIRRGPSRLIGANRFYRVAEVQTSGGPLFFKAGDASILAEASITELVANCAPGHAARTLALDPRGWWLMDGLPGRSLAAGGNKSDVLHVLEALASIQVRLACDPRTEQALALAVRMADLRAAVDATLREIDLDTNTAMDVERACDCLAAALASCDPLPLTWVHTDLAPANVLVSEGRPAFIDLNASVRSLPMLPLWRLLNAVKQRGLIEDRDLTVCCEAYERPWRNAGIDVLRRLWPSLRELGILLRIWVCRESRRVLSIDERNTHTAATQRHSLLRLVSALAPTSRNQTVLPDS